MKLAEQTARPVEKGTAPLSQKEVEELLRDIPQWSQAEKEIRREFRFKGFREAMNFVNSVAAIVNEQDHHPDIFISYNKVQLTFSTHKIGGLSLNDFIVAARVDLLAA
jgi:4a-hydroxytetrahydrobiopterin dehydratase